MNKYKNYYIGCIICLWSIFICIYFYVGNIAYDVLINRQSHYYFDDMIYVSDDRKKESERWYKEYARDVEITSNDGYKLKGLYLNRGSKNCILMVHGYRNDQTYMLTQVQRFYNLDYNILIIDLRGHGKSDGNYIGMGVKECEDIQLWIDYLKASNSQYNIVLYGVSMGGVSVLNCNYNNILCVISDSSYDDLVHLILYHLSMHPIMKRFVVSSLRTVTLLKAGFDIYQSSPISQILDYSYPVLYIHGTYDTIVPISHMYNLYNKTKGYKDYYVVNKQHGQCFKDRNYFKIVDCFIKRNLVAKK